VRIEMLEESLEIIRALWTGRTVSHRGKYYTVENARLYTLPDTPPEIHVSGFGPKATEMAGRIGDGYITMSPDADLVATFRKSGGAGKAVQGGFKAAYAPTEEEGGRIAFQNWPNAGVPGELSQVLPSPKHFEQASSLVTEDMVKKAFICGADPERHLEQIDAFAQAGFDEVYVGNTGPHFQGLFDLYAKHVLPKIH
jgi:G6PDH family F420-dependent oxidoreductase